MSTSFTFGTWYPIEDAPYDTPILVVVGQAWPTAVVLRYHEQDKFKIEDADGEFTNRDCWPLTHWMPLPPKPEQPNSEEM